MKNITEKFGTLYLPKTAFVIYEKKAAQKQVYIESYDIGKDGYPVNAHPLTVRECSQLAKVLDSSDEMKRSFLKPEGLLPSNVIYINPDHDGFAVWHTPARQEQLYFTDTLGIPNGMASLPALLWKAGKDTLHIYALTDCNCINEQTVLYHAPFFNIYTEGKVCMGTVSVKIDSDCRLEEFINLWQQYFFTSYFSHLFQGHNPVKGNIVQLWQGLVETHKLFPVKALLKNGLTIKNIIR